MKKFDENTGAPIMPNRAPINTRTYLYHPVRPAIVIEGKGETDAQKRESLAAQIEDKKLDGYSLTRFDGQHPHSNDVHRIDFQQRSAARGDKDAAAKLEAKAKPVALAQAEISEVGQLRAQLAALQAKIEAMPTTAKPDSKKTA